MAGLLGELSQGDVEQGFVAVRLALRDRPVALVATREQRAAGVGQQGLEAADGPSVQQDAGTHADGHGPMVGPATRRHRAA